MLTGYNLVQARRQPLFVMSKGFFGGGQRQIWGAAAYITTGMHIEK